MINPRSADLRLPLMCRLHVWAIALGLVWMIQGVLGASISIAQDNLPDLAPQVVEITGDLSISFPSLRRQPLAGFNPPPRVPDIPAGRIPYVGEYKQQSADLPASPLSSPVPPSMSSVADRSAASGMIEGGVGRYLTGYLKGTISAPVGSRSTISAWADMYGTGGREPFPDNKDVSTAADNQSGGAAIRSRLAGMKYGADVKATRKSYGLFGAVSADTSVTSSDPNRTLSDWEGSAFLSSGSLAGSQGTLTLGIGNSSVNTEIISPAAELPELPSSDESRFFARATGSVDATSGRLNADLSYLNQNLDLAGAGKKTVSSGSGSAGFRLKQSERLSVAASARVLGFSAKGQSETGGDRDLIYLSPEFDVRYSVSPGIQLSVANIPELEQRSYADLYRIAPFIQDAPFFQPVVTPIHFYGAASLSSERASLSSRIGWRDIKNYRVIEHNSAPEAIYLIGYPSISYEEASIFYVQLEGLAVIAPGVSASLSAIYRSGRLSDSDTIIPYLSPLSIYAELTFDPFNGGLLLRGTLRTESSRYRDREKTLEIDRVFALGLEAAYFVTSHAAAVVGIKDLGQKTEFYDNYEMDPGVLYAGIRWRW